VSVSGIGEEGTPPRMQELPKVAFVADPLARPALEVRVNFGIFAGREVTAAEIDELAGVLLPEVRAVSIVSEQRHEFDADVEGLVHQLRIEVSADALPHGADIASLGIRLTTLAEHWAEGCISERHAQFTED
jgi:hypothetical protein